MFPKIATFLLTFFAGVLQFSVLPNFFPTGAVPEITLLLIIFWTAQDGFEKTWPKAVFAGIITDLFHFFPIGVSVMAFSAVSYGVSFLSKRFLISRKNLGFFVMLVFVVAGSLLNSLILGIFLKTYRIFNFEDINFLMQKTLFNVLLFVIIYWPLESLEKFLSFYDKKSMQGRFFK